LTRVFTMTNLYGLKWSAAAGRAMTADRHTEWPRPEFPRGFDTDSRPT